MNEEFKPFDLFIGTKLIRAKAMTRLQYTELRGWQLPSDENGDDAGYLVEYLDGGKPNVQGFEGYVSWSPKDVFERAYRPTSGLDFGLALRAAKCGQAIARSGWNGKGMFVYLVPAAAYPAQTGIAKAYFGEDSLVPYNAYMAIKNADETVSTWVPSINDCLATDWHTV
jgi:hypothetical protein